jgi:hypothetical protein
VEIEQFVPSVRFAAQAACEKMGFSGHSVAKLRGAGAAWREE